MVILPLIYRHLRNFTVKIKLLRHFYDLKKMVKLYKAQGIEKF